MITRTTAVLLLACLTGCGDGTNFKKVYPVRGKLVHRGQPVGRATVNFAPVSGVADTLSSAQTDAAGAFTLSTYKQGDGAPPGEYAVTVYWPDNAPTAAKVRAAAGEELAPDRFKGAYSDPKKTKLRATVAERDNDILLEVP